MSGRRGFFRGHDPEWHEYARLPVPPDYPVAKALLQPGEVMYPGLGAMDWQQYLETIRLPRRRQKIREATRTQFLTNRRLIVLDEARRQKTDLPLRDVQDVTISVPPGKGIGFGEAMVRIIFRAGAISRWSAGRRGRPTPRSSPRCSASWPPSLLANGCESGIW